MDQSTQALARLNHRLGRLVWTHPTFYATIKGLRWHPDPGYGTMGVTMTSMKYDPDFVMAKSDEELDVVICHEAMHVLLGHPIRANGMQHTIANIAMDIVTNGILRRAGMELPAEAIDEPQHDGKDLETVYAEIASPEQDPEDDPCEGDDDGEGEGESGQGGGDSGDGDDDGDGGEGDQSDGDTGTRGGNHGGTGEVIFEPMTPESLAEHQRVVEAAITMDAASGRGLLADEIREHLLASVRVADKAWREVLRDFFVALGCDDFTYRRPDRNMFAIEGFHPSIEDDGLGELVICRDVSGSVSDETWGRATGYINQLLNEFRPAVLRVIDYTGEVGKVWELHNGEPLPNVRTGYGGTCVDACFRYIAKQEEWMPDGIIVMTDMEDHVRTKESEVAAPVLWLDLAGSCWGMKPSFGHVVVMKD